MAKYEHKPNFRELYNKRYGDIATVKDRSPLTPEQLMEQAVRYFDWAEKTALKAGETASYQGYISQHEVSKPRVFTTNGLCLFCGIGVSTFNNYAKQPGFAEVVDFIRSVIHEQKYQLAAAEMVNSALIIKDLGLDKSAVVTMDLTPEDGDDNEDAMRAAFESIASKL